MDVVVDNSVYLDYLNPISLYAIYIRAYVPQGRLPTNARRYLKDLSKQFGLFSVSHYITYF